MSSLLMQPRLRIALLGPANSIHLRRWASAMAARGHAVAVWSQHPCAPGELPASVQCHWLPHRRGLGYLLNGRRLRRELAQWRPDVLHVHYASGYGSLGSLSGVRPRLLSVWGSDVFLFPHTSRLHAALLRHNLRGADIVASTSQALSQELQRWTPERTEVPLTPFGVDLDRFSPRPAPRPGQRLSIGLLKALQPVYGVDLLLRAFADLRAHPAMRAVPCELLIVGGGPQEAELKALARELGITTETRFIGPVPHHEVPEWLNRMDICVAPSRSESFGVAVVEASACGVPVVVSRVGGLPEVVDDGVSGFIVPSEDVAALSAALLRLASDPVLRAAMGYQGRALMERRFAWPDCVDRMELLYRRLKPSAPTP